MERRQETAMMFLLCVAIFSCIVDGDDTTEYWVAFPQHTSPLLTPKKAELNQRLVIYNPSPTHRMSVQVFFPADSLSDALTVAPRRFGEVVVKESAELRWSSVERKGVRVVCSHAADVQVLSSSGKEKYSKSSGSYLSWPTHRLGQRYIVLTHCRTGVCFCVIIATENHTRVYISVRVQGGTVKFRSLSYNSDDVIRLNVQKGHVIHLKCQQCDLSGTLVTSTGPVAVITGARMTALKSSAVDMMMEQLPPWNCAASQYVLTTEPTSVQRGRIIKMVTNDVGTNVSVNDVIFTSNQSREVFELAEEAWSGMIHVTSNRPVLLAYFTNVQAPGSAVMTFPAPVTSWSRHYDVPALGTAAKEKTLTLTVPSQTVPVLVVEGVQVKNISTYTSNSTKSQYTNVILSLQKASVSDTAGSRVHVYCESDLDCCLPFTGSLNGYSDVRAWSIPLALPPSSVCSSEQVTTPSTRPDLTSEASSFQVTSGSHPRANLTTLTTSHNSSGAKHKRTCLPSPSTSAFTDHPHSSSSPSTTPLLAAQTVSSTASASPPTPPPPTPRMKRKVYTLCPCGRRPPKMAPPKETKTDTTDVPIARLGKESRLSLSPQTLSRLKKLSRSDHRMSSAVVGFVAIFLMLILGVGVLAMDIQEVVRKISSCCSLPT